MQNCLHKQKTQGLIVTTRAARHRHSLCTSINTGVDFFTVFSLIEHAGMKQYTDCTCLVSFYLTSTFFHELLCILCTSISLSARRMFQLIHYKRSWTFWFTVCAGRFSLRVEVWLSLTDFWTGIKLF